MNKKSKKSDFSKDENANGMEYKYKSCPANKMLKSYIESQKKITGKSKQEIYENIESETKIPVGTLKHYSAGKSTPKDFQDLDKLAEIFKCPVVDILAETDEQKEQRLKLLEKMGFRENSYNKLSSKYSMYLFGAPEQTYFQILNYIICESEFMEKYVAEMENSLGEILAIKKIEPYKNMNYYEFRDSLQDSERNTLDNMISNITNAFKKHVEKFIIERLG